MTKHFKKKLLHEKKLHFKKEDFDIHNIQLKLDSRFLVTQVVGNIEQRITTFLLHSINLKTGKYDFSVQKIERKYNCSRSSVMRSLSILRKLPMVRIKNYRDGGDYTISYIQSWPNVKGGARHAK